MENFPLRSPGLSAENQLLLPNQEECSRTKSQITWAEVPTESGLEQEAHLSLLDTQVA